MKLEKNKKVEASSEDNAIEPSFEDDFLINNEIQELKDFLFGFASNIILYDPLDRPLGEKGQ